MSNLALLILLTRRTPAGAGGRDPPRVTPNKNNTVSRYGWLNDASATLTQRRLGVECYLQPGRAQHVDIKRALSPHGLGSIGTPYWLAKSEAPWPCRAGQQSACTTCR